LIKSANAWQFQPRSAFQLWNRGSSWNKKLKEALVWLSLMSESLCWYYFLKEVRSW
jgi:hypothetical protein